MNNKLNSGRILTYFSVLGLTMSMLWPLAADSSEEINLNLNGVWTNALLSPEDYYMYNQRYFTIINASISFGAYNSN